MKTIYIRLLAPAAFLCLALCQPGLAWAADPFKTESLLPPQFVVPTQAASESGICAAPSAQTRLALLEVVDLALCNNPKTRESWASVRAQAAQVGVAQSTWLPTLAGNLSETRYWAARSQTDGGDENNARFNQGKAGLSLGWLLYDFGAREATLENARQLLAAALAARDSTIQTVFLAAVQGYYQVQATQAALDAARESERASQESFRAAEARYQAGSATPADRLQARTAWSQSTLNRITIEGNLKIAQGALANIVGLDAYSPLNLAPVKQATPDGTFERDMQALVEEARLRRPDLLAAEAEVRAAAANLDATRAADRPTLSLAGNSSLLNIADSPTLHDSTIGLNLNIPLFSGYAPTYQIRAAEASSELKAAQRDRLRLQVALDVWNAYQNLKTATESLRTSADLMESATLSEQVALGRYKAGVGTILDALSAQSALASARLQQIRAAFDWNLNRAALAHAMGGLDTNLLQTLPGVTKNP
ncbi:MAG: TolC family protein [Sulfuricellaceae bacterium]|nr:TolC family protein [Sulfuricellaceae bacterium]